MYHFYKKYIRKPDGAFRRFTLGAFVLLSLAPVAFAGTYSISSVTWGPATEAFGGVHTATSSDATFTASYELNATASSIYDTDSDHAKLVSRVTWKVVWTPSYTGETPPNGCSFVVTRMFAQSVHTEIKGDATTHDWHADAYARDILGGFMDSSLWLVGGIVDRISESKGSPTLSYLNHENNTTGFQNEGGQWVAYPYTLVSGEVYASTVGGYDPPGGRFASTYAGFAGAEAHVKAAVRLL